MLIAWNQVAFAALLASLLALIIFLLVRFIWHIPTLAHVAGLTLCAGFGLTLWFVIFNIFSLGWLDFDFPIPLFPVSPEDLSCMVVTGLTAFIYWQVAIRLPGQEAALANGNQATSGQTNNPARLQWWVWLLPAVAALIIDVYFI